MRCPIDSVPDAMHLKSALGICSDIRWNNEHRSRYEGTPRNEHGLLRVTIRLISSSHHHERKKALVALLAAVPTLLNLHGEWQKSSSYRKRKVKNYRPNVPMR